MPPLPTPPRPRRAAREIRPPRVSPTPESLDARYAVVVGQVLAWRERTQRSEYSLAQQIEVDGSVLHRFLQPDEPAYKPTLHRPRMLQILERLEYFCLAAQDTPLVNLHRAWRALTSLERMAFLTEMLTPNERRALLLGFEDKLAHEEIP